MRRRLRRLRFGGREFTWRAEISTVQGDGGDRHRCISVRVWGAGKNSRPVVVDLLSKSVGDGWEPAATDSAYPEARDIRLVIDSALALGWEIEARGGLFRLAESSGLELPEFLITDRLWRADAPDPTARVLGAGRDQV
ncbi:hypothetical protein [Nocardia sp. NPDC051832]|uniref:hypothetical protein n=1 Tax=Nocardia sp. NPDC051832 TaxID=3155673 RepID=UPI0034183C1A